MSDRSRFARQPRSPVQSGAEVARSREGLAGGGESLWQIYVRRFRKHRLGKIGLAMLLVFYIGALFAGILSPYTMRWTNKEKSYHPPTQIHWLYEKQNGDVTVKPWVYEKKLVNTALKEYGIVPQHSLRAVGVPARVSVAGLNAVSISPDPQQRLSSIVEEIRSHYTLSPDAEALDRVRSAVDRIENSGNPDARTRVQIDTVNKDGTEVPREVILAKGNKNFLQFFGPGVPYRFLRVFEMRVHAVTSQTRGFYPFGTDKLGRDVLSRMLYGSRISLTIGLAAAFITFLLGLIVGGLAGYFGGVIDNTLMRVSEVVISIPSLYLLFTLRAAFPPNLPSTTVFFLIVMALSLFGFATVGRVIRGMVLSIKTEEFVHSARTMGLSDWKVIRRHILPNTLSYVIVQATITIPVSILAESALSLLGLGITEPQSSWGLMLSVARNHRVVQDFPWILIPGFAIFLAVLAWNFFGDGIRDSIDPKSKV
jgi:peptide/nickel transport system permease protein